MKSLPARPSLESLRKQAKKLARDRSLPLREAQLQIAREYGFAGWRDLTAVASTRAGTGLEWAAAQARRIIHDNDVEALKQLLADFPALLTWRGNAGENDIDGSLMGMATGAFGDAFEPGREEYFTRGVMAALLIKAGAIVTPPVVDGILQSRARGLLALFRRNDLLPRTLKFHAALGDADAVRAAAADSAQDPAYEAFLVACGFQHEVVASVLLDRLVALDPELGARVDGGVGRSAFVRDFIENRGHVNTRRYGPWQVFVMRQVMLAIETDPAQFTSVLRREPWLLGDDFVEFQDGIIGRATLHDRGPIISALFGLEPAILRRQPPPPSQAIEFAMTYGRTHLIPLLTRIWPLPDDLPHAAGMGDLARVKRWFDASGAAALGALEHHYPANDARARGHLQWYTPSEQQVLDVALAFAVINHHFEVADFLLAHGADINTNWGSHEQASLLHELVGQAGTGEHPGGDYEAMKFVIDRGIDMTIEDYRWKSTAIGWAIYAVQDEKLVRWLQEAERQRATQ
jgi:hypothetical protein